MLFQERGWRAVRVGRPPAGPISTLRRSTPDCRRRRKGRKEPPTTAYAPTEPRGLAGGGGGRRASLGGRLVGTGIAKADQPADQRSNVVVVVVGQRRIPAETKKETTANFF